MLNWRNFSENSNTLLTLLYLPLLYVQIHCRNTKNAIHFIWNNFPSLLYSIYSLMNMRQLHILFNSAKTWHVVVCWFLCFPPNLPELNLILFWTSEQNNFRFSSGKLAVFSPKFTWAEPKILLNIRTEQF